MSLFEHVDDQTRGTLTHLRIDIQETVSIRTSLPSAKMFLTACDRSFPEPVLALVVDLASSTTSEDALVEKTQFVAQLGHYSGVAILLGLSGFAHSLVIPSA